VTLVSSDRRVRPIRRVPAGLKPASAPKRATDLRVRPRRDYDSARNLLAPCFAPREQFGALPAQVLLVLAQLCRLG